MMEQSVHFSSLSPAELRLLIRKEDPRIRTTTGLANGKNLKDELQAGVGLVQNHSLCVDFSSFVKRLNLV